MVLPRTSAFDRMFRSSAPRIARLRSTARTWRPAGRRTYASDHGPAKKSSDLPWMIGSIVVTVPSAAWLWQQGPKKGDHGHGHEEHEEHEEHEGDGGESEDKEGAEGEEGEEGKNEGEEKSADSAEAKSVDGDKDDSGEKEDSSEPESGDDKETPATSDDEDGDIPEGHVKKGKGEKQKGATRPKTETQEEKMRAKDVSGAKHPYLDSPDKSKKGEGVLETAKIHGTVDPQRNVRSPGDGELPEDQLDEKRDDRPLSVKV